MSVVAKRRGNAIVEGVVALLEESLFLLRLFRRKVSFFWLGLFLILGGVIIICVLNIAIALLSFGLRDLRFSLLVLIRLFLIMAIFFLLCELSQQFPR